MILVEERSESRRISCLYALYQVMVALLGGTSLGPPWFWTHWTAVDSPKILDVFKGLVAVATYAWRCTRKYGSKASFRARPPLNPGFCLVFRGQAATVQRVLDLSSLNSPSARGSHSRGWAARGLCRCRKRQDPRHHVSRCAPDLRARRGALEDPRGHLHQQGRGRNATAAVRVCSVSRAPPFRSARFMQPAPDFSGATVRASALTRTSRSTTIRTSSRWSSASLRDLGLDEKRYQPKAMAGRINRAKQEVQGARRHRNARRLVGGRAPRVHRPTKSDFARPTRSTLAT